MTSPPTTMGRADRFAESLCACAGLALLASAWAFGAGAWLELRAIPALPSTLTVGALFYAVHLRTRARRERLGLRRPALPAWAMAAAAASFMALKLSFDTLLLTMVPDPGPGPVSTWLRSGGGWTPVVVALVLLVPLMEEVIFRGWLQRWLQRRHGAAAAVLATAVTFALGHFNLAGIPSMLLGGLVLGYAAHASGSLWTSVLLHVAANATVALSTAGLPFGTRAAAVLLLPSAAVLVWLGIRFRGASGAPDAVQAHERPADPPLRVVHAVADHP